MEKSHTKKKQTCCKETERKQTTTKTGRLLPSRYTYNLHNLQNPLQVLVRQRFLGQWWTGISLCPFVFFFFCQIGLISGRVTIKSPYTQSSVNSIGIISMVFSLLFTELIAPLALYYCVSLFQTSASHTSHMIEFFSLSAHTHTSPGQMVHSIMND